MTSFFTDASDDLILEILVRLSDCRAAIRCRTVCKRWNSLIAHSPGFVPSFIHHHARRRGSTPYNFILQNIRQTHQNSSYGLVTRESSTILSRSLDFLPKPDIIIRASSKDLLLVSSSNEKLEHYYVCNPSTREWFALPQLVARPAYLIRPVAYGFVCKDTSFRVVLFYCQSYNCNCAAEDMGWLAAAVFSSETLEWTETFFSRRGTPHYYYNVVAASSSGILYWKVNGEIRNDPSRECILAFDPFGEPASWRFLELPGWNNYEYTVPICCWISRSLSCLGVSGDQNRIRILRQTSLGEDPTLRTILVVYEIWECNGDVYADGGDCPWSLVREIESTSRDIDYPFNCFDPNDEDVVCFSSAGCCHFYSLPEMEFIKVVEFPRSVGDNEVMSLSVFPIANLSWPTSITSLFSC